MQYNMSIEFIVSFIYLACYFYVAGAAPLGTSFRSDDVNLTCSFDAGFCSWYNDSSADFNWRRAANGTRDATSGPLSDHTTGNGFFAYIEGADAHKSTWVANLVSPYVHIPLPTTLTFSYYMNGANIGSLRLFSETKNGITERIFEEHGRQGPDWHTSSVILQIGTYRLKFQATTGLHWSSDIAIDDIIIDTLFKLSPMSTTTAEPTTTQTSISVATTPMRPVTCTFDSNMCGWHQRRTDELKWLRSKGNSPDSSSGPLSDHTAHGSVGYYAYLNGKSSHNASWEGTLVSNHLHLTSQAEFSFWYHMNGPGIGSLSLLRQSTDGAVQEMWSKHGRQGKNWLLAEIMLPPGEYNLVFSATAKQHVGSDIAIDDIVLNTEVTSRNGNLQIIG